MGLGSVGLDFRGLLPSLFEDFQFVLQEYDYGLRELSALLVLGHAFLSLDAFDCRWAWTLIAGFLSLALVFQRTVRSMKTKRTSLPSVLMEHPPLVVFVNGISRAMNELRPCAPLSLKYILARKFVEVLKAVSDYLLRYHATQMLRDNESTLFLSLCRACMEVAYPHCATCFDRCYPGGGAIVMDAKGSYDGISRLLSVSTFRNPPKNFKSSGRKDSYISNSVVPVLENGGLPSSEEAGHCNTNSAEHPTAATEENHAEF